MTMRRIPWTTLALVLLVGEGCKTPGRAEAPQPDVAPGRVETTDPIEANFSKLFEQGRTVFRFETFGSEAYWGDQLRLHEAIAGEKFGGIGEGLTPRKALQLGLKVDFEAVPSALGDVLKGASLSFDDVKNTHNLLKHDAVIGVKAFYQGDRLVRVGITCALCHATVANTQMHGRGTFFDPRLDDANKFSLAARDRVGHTRTSEDRVSPKLAALHFYQLALPPPKPPEDSFDKSAAARGKEMFEGKA